MLNILNTRILLSVASIAAAITLVVGATFAFFSDTSTSSNNVFAAGTLNLQLSNDGEGYSDDVVGTFGANNMAPGQCTTGTLNLKNIGTVAGNHVDVSITNTNDDMDDYLRINSLAYDGSSQLTDITDAQPNTFKDLQDFESDQLVGLTLNDVDVNHTLAMEVCLDGSAPNSLQGATNTMVMTVFLDQGAHI